MSWYAVWSYASAFWTTVVIGCTNPMNWEYCVRVDRWLIPAVGDMMRAKEPYASERRILQSLERSNGLDGDRTKHGGSADS